MHQKIKEIFEEKVKEIPGNTLINFSNTAQKIETLESETPPKVVNFKKA